MTTTSIFRSRNDRGSALIELAVALSFIVLLSSGLIAGLYFSFAYVWLERTSYEAMLCLATSVPEQRCSTLARDRIESLVPIGEVGRIELERRKNSASVYLDFRIRNRVIFTQRSVLQLPLTSGQGHLL